MECITYKSGYKYQITQSYSTTIPIRYHEAITTDYIDLSTDGLLTIKKGYAWDGPSGPTFDTPNFMRGSLVHDALYQLMREEALPNSTYKDDADRVLRLMCEEDGMNPIRAWWVYLGVKFFGKPATDPANRKQPTDAPDMCGS